MLLQFPFAETPNINLSTCIAKLNKFTAPLKTRTCDNSCRHLATRVNPMA